MKEARSSEQASLCTAIAPRLQVIGMTEPRSYPHFAHTGAVRGPNAGHDSSIQTNFLKQHFTKENGELLDDGAYTSHIHGKRHHQHQNVLTPAGDKRLLSYFADQRLPLSSGSGLPTCLG